MMGPKGPRTPLRLQPNVAHPLSIKRWGYSYLSTKILLSPNLSASSDPEHAKFMKGSMVHVDLANSADTVSGYRYCSRIYYT